MAGGVGRTDCCRPHLTSAADVVDVDLRLAQFFDRSIVPDVPHSGRFLDDAVTVGILVDLNLQHVVVELHRQPVVTEPVAVGALPRADSRSFGFTDGAHTPRSIACALPYSGRDV